MDCVIDFNQALNSSFIMPSDSAPLPIAPNSDEIGTALLELEQTVAEFRDRYDQVQADEALRDQLQAKHQNLKTSRPELKAELERLATELDDVEMRLESQLVSWLGLREYFWQIVRFGGMGVLVGWGLTTWAMGLRSVPDSTNQPPVRLEQPRLEPPK